MLTSSSACTSFRVSVSLLLKFGTAFWECIEAAALLKGLAPRQKILIGYAAAALIYVPTISWGSFMMPISSNGLSIGHLIFLSALMTSAVTKSFKGLIEYVSLKVAIAAVVIALPLYGVQLPTWQCRSFNTRPGLLRHASTHH